MFTGGPERVGVAEDGVVLMRSAVLPQETVGDHGDSTAARGRCQDESTCLGALVSLSLQWLLGSPWQLLPIFLLLLVTVLQDPV